MHDTLRGLRHGAIAGAVGLVAMQLAQRSTRRFVKELPPKPTDVFLSERTMSPLGPQHRPGEGPTDALGRIAYERVVGKPPSARVKKALSWGVHIGYGLLAASLFGAVRAGHHRRAFRDGLVFGAALWLVGDELVVPLLGLQDKPTAYHPTRHAQSLVGHLGFGAATAETVRLLEGMR
jgi:hypothetical protein